MDYMNVALQCINYILRNTSFRMEVYPNWQLFHGSLIKNCSVYEQWGGSEAQARKDIGKGLVGWAPQKYLQTKPCTPHFHISHNALCLRVSCPPTHANSFTCALSLSSLRNFNCPERNVNNAYAKLPACAGGQQKHKQSGNLEMANCPVTNTHTHPYPNPSHHYISLGKHASNQWLWI